MSDRESGFAARFTAEEESSRYAELRPGSNETAMLVRLRPFWPRFYPHSESLVERCGPVSVN